ncbi:hypothetical protein AJ80_04930 [Polytolypa hystricis UAMH7299]|uniref:Ubiquitin-conjugating enzyme E2C-binding protein n=1 Tax=Polytolypa hystricis (strain UAMH7299) TaxID=1447883 RepID=A0A2B7Y839_POLH7|nr:hypothetical protein AJ80_04930 [Polytolypa hystricis UAMH7299]
MPSKTQAVEAQLYAELLPNIRQITLYASFPSSSSHDPIQASQAIPTTLECSFSLSSSRDSVTLSYNGQTQSLTLPARTSEASRAILASRSPTHLDPKQETELSFRLQADLAAKSFPGDNDDDTDGEIPWTAHRMGSGTKVRCRKCESIFLEARGEDVLVWKDLPSADWAEMMELWHCHKPDDHDHGHEHGEGGGEGGKGGHVHDENEVLKGYGAANRVVCEAGTVLVDVSSFIVAEEDCRGLKKDSTTTPSSPSQPKKTQQLLCTTCLTSIGEEHPPLQGFRIWKANVSVLRKGANHDNDDNDDNDDNATLDDGEWETIPLDTIVSAHLLELIERVGARRFAVHRNEDGDGEDGEDGILLWVFNPSLRYSHSHTSSSSPTPPNASTSSRRAMKVLYQPLPNVHTILNPETGTPSSASLEELCLPANLYVELLERLEEVRVKVLPGSARRFQGWEVGILDRF